MWEIIKPDLTGPITFFGRRWKFQRVVTPLSSQSFLSGGLKRDCKRGVDKRLYGIGVNEMKLAEMARWVRCSIGEFPFTYFGFLIGENMRRKNAWNPVVEKFKKRLADWKTMSFGGRLTLVRSVLGSLPLYYFSMFHVPLSVIKCLERIQKKIFWGGVGEGKKLSWVKWDSVIASHGLGLNIGSLRAKNLALLGKWWWRFRKEDDGLWVKVIKSIHGDFEGLRC
nr:putative RNA-directed DNA polymerase, eukaryota, reverse transcriptase zinc-binding domain protein [Tanacetum cinerariifolium]